MRTHIIDVVAQAIDTKVGMHHVAPDKLTSSRPVATIESCGGHPSDRRCSLLTMDSRSRRDAVAIPYAHNEEHCSTNQERR